jgi:ankyrin repeat protein
LQLDALTKCPTEKRLRATIETLPKTLDTFYERILLEIDEEDRQTAHLALQWLAYAARDITLAELAEAMVARTTEPPYVDLSYRFMDVKYVFDMLPSGLVTTWSREKRQTPPQIALRLHDFSHENSSHINMHFPLASETDEESTASVTQSDDHETSLSETIQGSSTSGEVASLSHPERIRIQLAHFSVQEYLVSHRIGSSEAAYFQISQLSSDNLIAEVCFAYMNHLVECSETISDKNSRVILVERTKDFPLFLYAITYWKEHLKRLESHPHSETLDRLCQEYLGHVPSDWQIWLYMDSPDTSDWLALRQERTTSNLDPPLLKPLRYVSDISVDTQIRHLVFKPANPKKEEISELLHSAACFGRTSIVPLLLNAGSQVDDRSFGILGAALHAAWYNEDKGVLRFLSKSDSNLDTISGMYGTPLTTALRWLSDYEYVVSFLLDQGADPNIPNREGCRPLNLSITRRKASIVSKLINAGANLESTDLCHSFPLHEAAELGEPEIVRVLLEHGANIHSRGGAYGGPMEAAARGGNVECILLLLTYGADAKGVGLNEIGRVYKSPLEQAVDQRRVEATRLLLDHGASEGREAELDKMLTHLRRTIAEMTRERLYRSTGWQREDLEAAENVLRVLKAAM